jgi:peroxiredoxin
MGCLRKRAGVEIISGADGLILRDKQRQKSSASQSGILTASLLGLTAVTILAVPLSAWSARPVLSEAAPDFALKSVTGDNLRLSEYRGEVVMLYFWSTRCGRCRDQLTKLNVLYSEHREQEFQLLSVNIDKNQDLAREATASLGLQFPVMIDAQKTVSRLYELGTIPFTVLIDPTGMVRYLHAGYKRGDELMYGDEMEILLAE